jgi:hypothetical protein
MQKKKLKEIALHCVSERLTSWSQLVVAHVGAPTGFYGCGRLVRLLFRNLAQSELEKIAPKNHSGRNLSCSNNIKHAALNRMFDFFVMLRSHSFHLFPIRAENADLWCLWCCLWSRCHGTSFAFVVVAGATAVEGGALRGGVKQKLIRCAERWIKLTKHEYKIHEDEVNDVKMKYDEVKRVHITKRSTAVPVPFSEPCHAPSRKHCTCSGQHRFSPVQLRFIEAK